MMRISWRLLAACLLITNALSTQIDTNGNGMSDVWEKYYGVEGANPLADSDGDGADNLAESLAGTDPLQAGSVFGLTNTHYYTSAIQIKWASKAGVIYQLEHSSSLEGQWNAVGRELEGRGGDLRVAHDRSGIGSSFYRVKITGLPAYNDLSDEAESLVGQHDTDGDGVSDVSEIRFGSNPLVAGSSLPVPSISVGGCIEATWDSEKGKLYQVWSSEYTDGPWTLEGVPYPGSGESMSAIVDYQAGVSEHVRVTVEDVDTDVDGVNDWEELQMGLDPEMAKTDTLGSGDFAASINLLTATDVISVRASRAVASITRMEAGGFKIMRTGGVGQVSIAYSVGGTAVAGSDYAVLTEIATIPFGERSVVVPVTPIAGSSISLSESVVLTLQDMEAYNLGTQDSQQVNVIKEVAINVKDHGAVGDGITDDAAAIQLALGELEQSVTKNTLYFPSGTYRLNTIVSDNHTGTSSHRILLLGDNNLDGRDLVITGDPGSKLFSTVSPERAHMLMIMGTFRSLGFHGMSWEKDSVPLRERVGVEPNGADGVSIVRVDHREIESVGFWNCTFINCHGAVHTYGAGVDTHGELRHFGMYSCEITNPYGANTENSVTSWGGGQQVKIWPWIARAEYVGNLFDGGSADMSDVSTSPGGRVKDGCHFGGPLNLLFDNNTVLRMGVEAILQTNDISLMGSTTASFVMPLGDNLTQVDTYVSPSESYLTDQIINIRSPLTPGQPPANNILRVISYNAANNKLTIVNTGHVQNLAPGTELASGRKIYLQYADPSKAVITNNVVDGTKPIGGLMFPENSGIVSLARSVIRGNVIKGYWSGIHLYKDVKAPLSPAGRGSIIDANVVLTRDSSNYPSSYTYGIQMFSGEEVVINNFTTTPIARKVTGIIARGNNSTIQGNTVIARGGNRYGILSYSRAVGISLADESTGVTIRDNCTYGHDIGVSPLTSYIWVQHEVYNHHSVNDTLSVHPSGLQHE